MPWMSKRQLPVIRLQDPLLHNSFSKGKYTTYKIIIETEHHAFHLRSSCVRRRYSELRWLYDTLRSYHKQIKLPPTPSKKIWSERFHTSFVTTRMKEMDVFLNALIQIDAILSDTAIHLFLQTDLTTDEMEGYLNGTVSEDLITHVWKNHGHLHTANELGTFLSIATPREIEMDEEDELLASNNSDSFESSQSSSSSSKTFKTGLPDNSMWVPPQIPELTKTNPAPAESTNSLPRFKTSEKGDNSSVVPGNHCSDNENNNNVDDVIIGVDNTRESSPALSSDGSQSLTMSIGCD